MSERLTWEQIQEKYPDQWVGLAEVEYELDNVFQLGVVGYFGWSNLPYYKNFS